MLPWLIHVLLAVVIGAAIGWQRQLHGSSAGLRTHILVCLGAALLTSIDMLHASFQGKIAAAVVTGIGFLGAGTIIHSDKGDSVRGLTTAASVWVTAGIGIALGTGGISTWLGVFVALLVLATLSVVYSIEEYALRQRRVRSLSFIIARPVGANTDDILARIIARLNDEGAAVEGIFKENKASNATETAFRCQVRLPDSFDASKIIAACSGDKDITQVLWNL